MIRRRNSVVLAALAGLFLNGCGEAPAAQEAGEAPCATSENLPRLGLMTSLPLYWPLGTDVADLAAGTAETPWQREVMSECYTIAPLDTLSPIPALSPDDPEIDPLKGIDRLAVIQPRGLSPADNVALDDWVRGGGRLLLVLDPLLTGEYDAPLGDPSRPVDEALIPPVVAHWGLSIAFDEAQSQLPSIVLYEGGGLFRSMAGEISISPMVQADCEPQAESILVRCTVGRGSVTLLADAATFEVRPREPSPVERRWVTPLIIPLLTFAFE